VANLQCGNLYYIDSTATLAKRALRIYSITITATAASAILKLEDATVSGTIFDGRVATSGDSVLFDYADQPLVLPNGLKVATVTNAVATIVCDFNRG
jgi:hypothetical protein